MPEKLSRDETDALSWVIEWLVERLPSHWAVTRSAAEPTSPSASDARSDAVLELRGPQSYTPLVVDVHDSFQPRDLDRLRQGPLRTMLELQRVPLLVAAPWLSTRTQELLAAAGVNYLDSTGNALIKLDNPALYMSSQGRTRNPQPRQSGLAGLRGGKAARLMRLLADVRPPYGVGTVAAATELTQGYVSRLLDTLDREALIERSRRGAVESVDVAALIKRWAQSYDLLKTNDAATFIAPSGVADAHRRLGQAVRGRVVTTGSFAAVRLAPIAAPSLLALYVEDSRSAVDALDLLPADEGANVVLLRPFDPVVWERTRRDGDERYAAPSQVAVDCLTGTGRMPAEGEALLSWMTANESSWRWESLAELMAGTGRGSGVE